MDNNFKKFKNKLMIEHLLKAILFGITGGLSASSISLITSCAAGALLNPMAHVGIGLTGFVATALSYFFVKKPSDKKIAARMDAAFQGNEKYLTMVEYQDKEGLIIEKQREDAQQELRKKSQKALPLKLSVWSIPALILAGGFFTASCFTPQIKQAIENNIPADNPFDDIHNDINNGGADDGLKDDLNDIIDKVEDDINNGKDPDVVINDAKDAIDDAVDNANSKEEIGDELIKSEDPLLKELGEAIKAGDQERVDKALQAIYDDLSNYSGYKLANRLEAIADEIDKALNRSGIPEGDPLRDDLQKLADKFREIAKALKDGLDNGEDNSDQAKDDIKDAVDEAKEDINKDLDQQNKNQEAGDKTKEDLDKLKDPEKKPGDQNDQDKEKEPGSDDGEQNDQDQSNNDQSGDQGGNNQDSQDGSASGDGENKNSGEGEGNGNNDGDDSSGDATGDGKGDGKGESHEGENQGGNGAGTGTPDAEKKDKIYTGDGYSEYDDAIGGYYNDAVNEADGELDSDVDDYFDIIYGNGDSGTNP